MINLSPDEKKNLLKHLNASIGFLELGLPLDAWNELESIEAKHRSFAEVLKVRLEVCRALEKWEMMAEIAQFLAKGEPEESSHLLNFAYAMRRFEKVEVAEKILTNAESKFPEDPLIQYNLGCYRAVLGRLAEARLNLAEAFQRDPDLRITALDDPDLEGIW
jgi:predicted Zn-dependent protease